MADTKKVSALDDSEKIKRIKKVITMAENWAEKQVMSESSICIGALKDIRRIVNK